MSNSVPAGMNDAAIVIPYLNSINSKIITKISTKVLPSLFILVLLLHRANNNQVKSLKQGEAKMAQREIKYESKAHKIFEGKSRYKDDEVIAIAYESRTYGTLHNFYILGSVVGTAIEDCECPFKAVEKAKKMNKECPTIGGELHWANPKSTMLTSHERPQEYSFLQKHGDKIKFHGKTFEIVPTPNNNISLKLV